MKITIHNDTATLHYCGDIHVEYLYCPSDKIWRIYSKYIADGHDNQIWYRKNGEKELQVTETIAHWVNIIEYENNILVKATSEFMKPNDIIYDVNDAEQMKKINVWVDPDYLLSDLDSQLAIEYEIHKNNVDLAKDNDTYIKIIKIQRQQIEMLLTKI
jgi:hypothetical protein